MSANFPSHFWGEGVGDIFLRLHVSTWPITKLYHRLKWYGFRCLVGFQFFFETTPVSHLGKWRCSQKGDHFEKEIMFVFREVTSEKHMHRKSASVSSNLFPICSLWHIRRKNIKNKNYLNETEWNHLDFRKTPRKKKRPPKTTKTDGMAAVPSTELTELPLPLERSNFTSGHSSLWRIAQVKKQEPIRKGFKVVSGSLLVASEEVLMNLYVYCSGGRAKCYQSSQWTLGNFFHCWSVLILHRFCWVYPSCF